MEPTEADRSPVYMIPLKMGHKWDNMIPGQNVE